MSLGLWYSTARGNASGKASWKGVYVERHRGKASSCVKALMKGINLWKSIKERHYSAGEGIPLGKGIEERHQ